MENDNIYALLCDEEFLTKSANADDNGKLRDDGIAYRAVVGNTEYTVYPKEFRYRRFGGGTYTKEAKDCDTATKDGQFELYSVKSVIVSSGKATTVRSQNLRGLNPRDCATVVKNMAEREVFQI